MARPGRIEVGGELTHDRLWLDSALQSLPSARLKYGTNRTFGRVSAALGHRADMTRVGHDRPVVDPERKSRPCSDRMGLPTDTFPILVAQEAIAKASPALLLAPAV